MSHECVFKDLVNFIESYTILILTMVLGRGSKNGGNTIPIAYEQEGII